MSTRLIVIMLLAAFLAGCDEFETELAIGPDGSGKLVQSFELSPMAQLLLQRHAGAGMDGWRPVLNEEEADVWRESNAESGVKLLSYSSERMSDGSLRIRSEILFIDLPSLSRSAWGWPLRLSYRKSDQGQVLSFDDPARYILSRCLEAQRASNINEEVASQDRAVAAAIMAECGQTLASRLVVHLPSTPAVTENAAPGAEKTTVLREQKLNSSAEIKEWLSGKQTKIQFRPETLRIGEFETPSSITSNRLILLSKPLDLSEKSPLRLRLSSVKQTWHRGFEAGHYLPTESGNSRWLEIHLRMEGDDKMFLLNPNGLPQNVRPTHMFSVFKDGDGNDLRMNDARLDMFFSMWGGPYVQSANEKAGSSGDFSISTEIREGFSPKIVQLSGYAAGIAVTREEIVRVGPISELMNKEISLPGQTLIIKVIGNDYVDYAVRHENSYGNEPMHRCRWLTLTGDEIYCRVTNRQGNNNKEFLFRAIVSVTPADYLEIRCPAVLREVHIPFDFKDIEIP